MPVVDASFSVKFCQLALLVGVKQHLIFNRLWGGLPIYNVLPGRVALPTARRVVRAQDFGWRSKIRRSLDGFAKPRFSVT
jgi:hypothetical protein